MWGPVEVASAGTVWLWVPGEPFLLPLYPIQIPALPPRCCLRVMGEQGQWCCSCTPMLPSVQGGHATCLCLLPGSPISRAGMVLSGAPCTAQVQPSSSWSTSAVMGAEGWELLLLD